MSLFFEHENLRRYLAACSKIPTPSCILPVLIAWSSRAGLLRQPAYAWLSHPDARHIRLPKSLEALQSELEVISQTSLPSGEIDELLTPLGQCLWALDQLERVPAHADVRDAALRREALRGFLRRNWPGWYDQVLFLSVRRPDVLGGLQTVVGAVAVSQAVRPLLRWTGDGDRATVLGELQDSLCYGRQELTGARADGGSAPGWDEMEADLAVVRAELETVRCGGGVVPDVVSEGLLSLERALVTIRIELKPETLDNIVRSVASLGSFVSSTRRKLSQSAEMGEPPP